MFSNKYSSNCPYLPIGRRNSFGDSITKAGLNFSHKKYVFLIYLIYLVYCTLRSLTVDIFLLLISKVWVINLVFLLHFYLFFIYKWFCNIQYSLCMIYHILVILIYKKHIYSWFSTLSNYKQNIRPIINKLMWNVYAVYLWRNFITDDQKIMLSKTF